LYSHSNIYLGFLYIYVTRTAFDNEESETRGEILK
jgi:hypothetical protein